MKNKWSILIVLLAISIAIPSYFVFQAANKDMLLKHYLKTTTLYTAQNDFLRFVTQKSIEDLNQQLPDSLKLETIHLLIADSVLKQLDIARHKKLEVGVRINRNVTEYYPISVIYNNDTLPAKVRIRGDTHENFNRGLYNVSLRIDILKGKDLMGLKKLSFIRPFQDNNFFGFFYYNFFKSEGLLANRFQFTELKINNESHDIWILQEGFSNKLISNNNKPKGLLLRFENDCMELNLSPNPSGFPKLIPYQYKKVRKDTFLNSSYNYVLAKLDQLKTTPNTAASIFDLPKWAKYVALSDIFLSHHSQECHNVKLYFNTKTNLIEPIAWDPNSFKDWPLEQAKNIYTQNASNPVIYQFFAQDTVFTKLYLDEVKSNFTHKKTLQFIEQYNAYVNLLEPELNQHQASIKFSSYYIEHNLARYRRYFNVKQKLKITAYKRDKIVEIKSNVLLPVYCSHIKVDDNIIPVNKIIHKERPLSFFLDSVPKKKVKVYYKLCNESTLTKEKGNVFEYKIWD